MGRTSNTTINLRMSSVFSALNQNYSIDLSDIIFMLYHVLSKLKVRTLATDHILMQPKLSLRQWSPSHKYPV